MKTSAFDPATHVLVAGVPVFDGLEQALQLVGIVRAVAFDAASVLVVGDQRPNVVSGVGGQAAGCWRRCSAGSSNQPHGA